VRASGSNAAALQARPHAVAAAPPVPGEHALGLREVRDALLYVPAALERGGRPAALAVSLHGAGGDAAGGLALLRWLADRRGFAVLAPASQGSTWDAVGGEYGVDVHTINQALQRVFRLLAVDPEQVGVAGFSDGASYALGLGLANGELFGHVIAFSPGFIPPARHVGRPAVFVSHGEDDAVLPIARTSARIVPALRREGYDVLYRDFDGGHTVPPQIAEQAVEWLGWSR
jgi:predicted esterase